jgi:protein O-GlcNAcase / histone acetyltransferase
MKIGGPLRLYGRAPSVRMAKRDPNFLAGVIEGFYGQPWSDAERSELFRWMASWGLNTYVYGPKDDLKHRSLWRERYIPAEAEALKRTIRACHRRGLSFVYALSPGLSIRYSDKGDQHCLRKRFEQMLGLGCRHFCLLFDDIPGRLDSRDIRRWGSLASAQSCVSNDLFRWVRSRIPEARFLFCPTAYCGRMAERKLGGEGYLATLGRELLPEVDVFWTGPEIVSREITTAPIRELQVLLRRKPLIWDNLHANDYDGRRFYCGPYSGRPAELRREVSGLLVNPNSEFPLNYVPLCTLADFVRGKPNWNPRKAYLAALRAWLPRFATVGQPVSFEQLVAFGDCFYLPHEEGPEAEALLESARAFLGDSSAGGNKRVASFRRRAARLRDFCLRCTEVRHRPLFHALNRRIWELREELDLLERYMEFSEKGKRVGGAFRSDFHLPQTYRGGIVARLQRLLVEDQDGTFAPASSLGQSVSVPTTAT